jgi:hypothetical protein
MHVDILLIEDNLGDALLIRDAVNRLSLPVNLHVALDGSCTSCRIQAVAALKRVEDFGICESLRAVGKVLCQLDVVF